MIKLLIIVLSHKDNGVYDTFYDTQKKTWVSTEIENVNVFHVFGNNNCDEIVGNEIHVNVDDDRYYNGNGYRNSPLSATLKTIKAFELVKNMDYDFLLRTTLTSYIDKGLVLELLKNKPLRNYYGGYTGVVHTNIRGEKINTVNYASGSCMVFSKDVIDIILNNKNMINNDNLLDDVAIGSCLNKENIIPESIINSRDGDFATIRNYNLFYYKLKTNHSGSEYNREADINNMYLIHENKKK